MARSATSPPPAGDFKTYARFAGGIHAETVSVYKRLCAFSRADCRYTLDSSTLVLSLQGRRRFLAPLKRGVSAPIFR